MSDRSEEWLDEFGPAIDELDEDIKALVLDGSIEICPVCGKLSAYCWDDATDPVAHIPACSGWEWQCGHCGAHLMDADSPLNHPAYTHSED